MTIAKKLFKPIFYRILCLSMTATLLCGLLPFPVLAQMDGTIAGQVTDNSNANPIPNVEILLSKTGEQPAYFRGETDAVGEYTVTVPEDTDYEVVARKTGYVTQTVTGQAVTAGISTTVNLSLQPGGVIQVIVMESNTETPVPGASIYAYKPESPGVRFLATATETEGIYSLTVPPDAGYTVEINKDGYMNAAEEGVGAILASTTTINFSLDAEDNTPPTAVSDLVAGDATYNSLILTWSAPGDDADVGQAARYDIRYASEPITESNWATATSLSEVPLPAPAGQSETFTVGELNAETTCFFAIKSVDEVELWSGLSNVASGTTTSEPAVSNVPQSIVTEPAISGTPPGMMVGPGMLLPAIEINVAGDSGESLVSVKINILVPSGSEFDPTTGLAPLSATDARAGITLYKDNKSAGDYGYLDPPEDFHDIHLPLASTPSWTQNGSTYETTLNLASPDAVPESDSGNNAGSDYFAIVSTSANPLPGATFQVQIPADGVILDTTTFPTAASPLSPNIVTVGQGGMMGSPVVISEIQTAGATAADEFIELYNRTPGAIDLASWSIQYQDGAADALSSESPADKVNLSGTIQAFGFFLIANSSGYDYGETKAADITYTDADFALSASGGTVLLVNNQDALISATTSAIQDRMAWGNGTLYPEGTACPSPADGGSLERKACPESTATSMVAGIDAAMGNSFDSDDNSGDFVLRSTADPQNTADVESPEMSGVNPVVINEVYYKNASSDHQWIELYNNAGTPQDISGWKILAAGKTYTIPALTSIGADGFLVVHWYYGDPGNNTETDLYTDATDMAPMPALAGDVFLSDEGDGARDYVEYGAGGQSNESIAGGSHWPAGDYVPDVLQGESIGRGNNGYDSNRASDWQTFASPTRGATNTGGDSFPPGPVSSVVLTDNDTTDFGLDGNDVTVSWSVAATPDPTFDQYIIFLLPEATALDTVVHTPFFQVYGGQNISSFTAPPAKTKDSAGNDLTDGNYRAYVVAVDMALNRSAAVASAAAPITAETSVQAGDDTLPPMIMSMPVWSAREGSDSVILAHIYDDRGLDETYPVQVKWRVNGQGTFNAITGSEVESGTGLYRAVIPWNSAWDTATEIDYYIMAKDTAENYTYFTASPAFDTAPGSHEAADETEAATFCFTLSFTAAAGYNRTISGTIYNSTGALLSDAGVVIPGSGIDIVTTGTDGVYSFTVADGTYSIAALKAGYMEGWIDGVSVHSGNTASSGNDFYLSEGWSGMGGDGEKAFVRWTDPSEGMIGVPVDIDLNAAPIVAHVSEPMDSSTIIDADATDAGSNIFLTTNGQDRVSGQVSYNESDSEDPKIIFHSSTALSKGTTYIFVITQAVTDLAGNPIEGNQPDGRYVMEFTTFSDATGGTYGEGVAFPPYVTGTMPVPGAFNVPVNTKISVSFSEPMDPSTIEATNSTGLSVRLYDPDYQNSGTGEYIALSAINLDDATNTMATLIIGGTGNLVSNHYYEIRVLGGVRSSKGIYIADPSQSGFENQVVYQAGFDTGGGADSSGAPQIMGTNLEMYRQTATGDIAVAGCLVDVPVNIGVINVGFSKDMDPATINRTTISLKVGTTLVKGTVSYKPLDRVAMFSPSGALSPNTTYTLKVQGGINGVTDTVGGEGHYLASDYYAIFTTSSQSDTEPPSLTFAKASDFGLTVAFSEPVNTAKITNTTHWPASTLNPANYTLYTDTGPPEVDPTGTPYSGNGGTTGNLGEATGLAFKYDSETSTIVIEGLELTPVGGFRIWVNDVTDLSGNTIRGNIGAPDIAAFGQSAAGGPIEMMGQGGPGMDMGDMGMMPVGAFPMNMIAGATTNYMVDIPLNRAIPADGSIVLTFPSGFDISGARNADPDGTWAHQDINGPGPGTVVLGTATESPQSGGLNNDGITVNTSARTITIKLGSTGTAGYQTPDDTTDDHDFIHLEVAGIKNSNIPKSFETSGYTIDIKTMTGGNLLESVSSMPFFITEAGAYSIAGTITFPNNVTTVTGEPIEIFGGSPMVGPIAAEVSFNNTTSAGFSITGLPAGEYMVMTEPMVTITGGVGDGDYFGLGNPEPIWIDDNTTVNGVYTKNYTFTSSTGKPALSVSIIGDFSGEKSGDVDIFANSPMGSSIKTINLNGNYTAESPLSTTLYLPADGSYMVGMGPAMPKGTMPMGPPPMPEWMPPPSIEVRYDGSNWTESSATPNDGNINFTVGTALTVNGHVLDGSGNAIPNTEVFAYSPMGMFGTHASSLPDGSFILYLPEGMYKVGAFLPGMPPSGEIGVDVRSVGGETKVYVDGAETTDIVIKIAKPERTISGKVTDGTNTISGASVYAYRADGPGHAEAMTDSSGVYILYVNPGSWNVGAFLPGYGPLPEKAGIQVSTVDKENINFYPETGVTYIRISGNVSIGGLPQAYMPIRAVEVAADGSFTGYENGASTDGSGNYSINVKGTTSSEKHYRVDIWTPEYGEVAANSGAGVTNIPTPAQPWNVAVANLDVSNVDINVGAGELKTLTISFTGGTATMMTAYVDIMRIDPATKEPLGMGRHFEVKDLSATTTVNLPAGSYHGFAHIPGYGEFIPTEGQTSPYYLDLTSDTTCTFDLSGLGESTVSGTVYDGQGNPIPDAFVHIGNPETGMHFGTPTDASGNYSLAIMPGTFMMGAEKPGYISEPTTITVSAGANIHNLTITKTSLTISGYVYSDVNSNSSYDSGEGLSFAFVHAEKLGGGFAGTPVDPDGSYTLYVSPGDWRLSGVAEGYQEKAYTGNPVAVGSTSVSGINILLSDTISLAPPYTQPFTPASGATFEDQSAGLKITVPPMAAGSETSDYQVQAKETSNLPSSPTAAPLGGKGKKVMFFDGSGNPVTTLNDDITIAMSYTKAELEAAGFSSLEEIAKIKLAYWDDSASSYVRIPTTIAYDPTTETTWATLVSVTFKGTTSHLTVFSPIVTTDGLTPATPTGLVSVAGNGQVSLSWNAPTTNADSSTLVDLLGYEIYRATSATGTYTQINTTDVLTNSCTDTTVTNGTAYFYKVTAADTGGNESVKSSASDAVTPSATSLTGGGFGGGSATVKVNTADFSSANELKLNTLGLVQQSAQLKTQDGKASLDIALGTKLMDSKGNILSALSSGKVESPPAPPPGKTCLLAYDFGPDGARFEPGITLSLSYDPQALPEGIVEDELCLAYWDGKQWQLLESTADSTAQKISATVNHFTQFAVIGKLAAPAAFNLGELNISPSEAEIGELIVISTVVSNTGGQSGSYEIALQIDGTLVDTAAVTLAANTSEKVTFSITGDTLGSHEIDVNGLVGTFVVVSPAAITISGLSIVPQAAGIGEEIAISVLLSNTGDLTASREVVLKIDGELVTAKHITLAGGAEQRVSFTTKKDTPGTYAINVNRLGGSFTVADKAATTPPAPTKTSNWWFIGSIGTVVMLTSMSVWYLTRRRRPD